MATKKTTKVEFPRIVRKKGQRWGESLLLAGKVSDDQFKKLTRKHQRMFIAADVIQQLDAHKIRPQRGVYISLGAEGTDAAFRLLKKSTALTMDDDGSYTVEAREFVRAIDKMSVDFCRVCAMGAVFLSTLERLDNLKVSGRDGFQISSAIAQEAGDAIWLDEQGPFSVLQQRQIEACFECSVTYAPHLHNSADKLRALMVNIVRNKGNFVAPPKVAVELADEGFGTVSVWKDQNGKD